MRGIRGRWPKKVMPRFLDAFQFDWINIFDLSFWPDQDLRQVWLVLIVIGYSVLPTKCEGSNGLITIFFAKFWQISVYFLENLYYDQFLA
jgi:hypothetical protein